MPEPTITPEFLQTELAYIKASYARLDRPYLNDDQRRQLQDLKVRIDRIETAIQARENQSA